MERKITIFLLALLSLYLSPSFCLFLSSLVLSLSFISLSISFPLPVATLSTDFTRVVLSHKAA